VSQTFLALLFNCILASLLVATISYCSKLSKRIKILQDGRKEFGAMLMQFDDATSKAVMSVNELQTVSKKMTDALQLKIDKANFLADDLAFLIEKSNKVILQLEQIKLHEGRLADSRLERSKSEYKDYNNKNEIKTKPSIDNILQIINDSGKMREEEKLSPRTQAEKELIAALQNR
jgi:hypothetical protein